MAAKKTTPSYLLAYDYLKQHILDGHFPEGSAIRQDDIASLLNLSKIPVREALMRLEADGLVTFTPNIGASVAVFTLEDYLDILDIRTALECKALELAIPGMTPEIIAQAQVLLDTYRTADTARARSRLNMEFHRCLYQAANRPRLLQLIDANQDHVGKLFRRKITEFTQHKRSCRQHQAILDACAAGECKKAIRLLRQHIDHTQDEIRRHFAL